MKTILIENFKLKLFRSLLDQSLTTSNELMFEVTNDMIKSCSFSQTKSLIKLWTIPLRKLVEVPTTKSADDIDLEKSLEDINDEPEIEFDFDKFNFYILRGDLFKKYLSVYSSEVVNIEFTIDDENGKNQGEIIKITGVTESNFPLTTTFILTKEKMLSNTIDDYTDIIRACTPDVDMFEFIISDSEVREIKRLIKNLHRSTSNNTSYLTFNVDTANKLLTVNDSVFKVNLELKYSNNAVKENLPEVLNFNILKTDFAMSGNHTFSVYTKLNTEKIILGTSFNNSLIWAMTTKVGVDDSNGFSNSIGDAGLDDIDFDVAEYFGED